jgi:hypothetical protein
MAGKCRGGVMTIDSGEHKQRVCDRFIASHNSAAAEASVFLDYFSARVLLEGCRAEHVRRMGTFDPDLLQPRFLPRLAELAIADLRLGVRAPGSR